MACNRSNLPWHITGNLGTLRLPCFLERNFRIPEQVSHAVWIGDTLRDDLSDKELIDPANTLRVTSETLTAAYTMEDQSVLQTIRKTERPAIDRLAVVIDSSACMRDHIDSIADALEMLPSGMEITICVADDEPRIIDRSGIRSIKAEGGKDNCAALRETLMKADINHVVWVHGPQTWSFSACEKIRQVMERDSNKRIFAYQIGHGPHRLVEKMDNLAGFESIPSTLSPKEDLARLFTSFAEGTTVWKAERSLLDQIDTSVYQADDHLLRLYVLDQIAADLGDGDADSSKALELALRHRLVTPVSGAVVLETQQQYDEANLKPVNSSDVPNVPEPSVLMLLLLAAVLLYSCKRFAALIKSKLEV